jgi:hypothetical protein
MTSCVAMDLGQSFVVSRFAIVGYVGYNLRRVPPARCQPGAAAAGCKGAGSWRVRLPAIPRRRAILGYTPEIAATPVRGVLRESWSIPFPPLSDGRPAVPLLTCWFGLRSGVDCLWSSAGNRQCTWSASLLARSGHSSPLRRSRYQERYHAV